MRSAVLFGAIVLLLLTTGAGSAALGPVAASCATAGRDATCQFACALGDLLVVLVQGESAFVQVQADAHCGGAVAQCQAFAGCAATSLSTSVPGIGTCATVANVAVTSCAAVPNARGLTAAGFSSCSVRGEGQSCYYSCTTGQRLVVSAVGPFPSAPASVTSTCGGQTASCSGTGTCSGTSPGRTTEPIGLGTCRPYSATTQVTCSVQ